MLDASLDTCGQQDALRDLHIRSSTKIHLISFSESATRVFIIPNESSNDQIGDPGACTVLA
jgi:hypothetical protein